MESNIWDKYPEIWKTQASFFSWMRGGIRRSLWSKHPVKLEFLKKNRIKIPNPNPRGKVKTVWGGECVLCLKTLPLNQIEVDHKKGNLSLNCVSDIQSFIEGIVLITEDDLQLCCKACHKAKSYSEKQGMSFKEALIEKQIIQIIKDKKDKEWLIAEGVLPESNAKKRRAQIRKIMEGML
jgi:5-methylcytosine-specific restriction endonuclease McrA